MTLLFLYVTAIDISNFLSLTTTKTISRSNNFFGRWSTDPRLTLFDQELVELERLARGTLWGLHDAFLDLLQVFRGDGVGRLQEDLKKEIGRAHV